MTVKDLMDLLDRYPEYNELIIMDVTNYDPEDHIQLYVKEVDSPREQKGTTYLLLKN